MHNNRIYFINLIMEKIDKIEKIETHKKHTLTLSDKITITGIENVLTLAEKEIFVKLSGRFLSLYGVGFTPVHLDINEGVLILAGEVLSLKYSQKSEKESVLKKIFK